MKRWIIPILLICVITACAQPEKKSAAGFTAGVVSEKQLDNLVLLGRVWGFLKYHHPAVGAGKFNWDNALIENLPAYINIQDDDARDQYLLKWIESLGKVNLCKSCERTRPDAFLKPDLNWIEAGSISKPLKEKLTFIYTNRHQGKHHYIKMSAGVGHPEFLNEDPYASMPYPDEAHRLLALFRYWNMIYYYFPYKHLMDEDWNLKLREYVPVFIGAVSELEYELAAVQLIGDIQDTHANLWGGANQIQLEKGSFMPPVQTTFIENQLVVTDFFKPETEASIELKKGDVITTLNGKPVAQLVKEKSKYYPASNEPTRLRNLSNDLLRSPARNLTVGYARGDAPERTMNLKLSRWDSAGVDTWYKKKRSVKSFTLLENNIGYITLATISMNDIPKIKEAFLHTKGIIIDIRNYPAAFVVFALSSYFVNAPAPFVKFTRAYESNPGEFIMYEYDKLHPDKNKYAGKLVVIVNEQTQSQAEYTTMALQAGANTTVIGSTTAGADGNVSEIVLPGGLKTMISGIGVYYPDGRETQRIGIVPDVEVKPTIDGIRNGKDELLEKAIALILE